MNLAHVGDRDDCQIPCGDEHTKHHECKRTTDTVWARDDRTHATNEHERPEFQREQQAHSILRQDIRRKRPGLDDGEETEDQRSS